MSLDELLNIEKTRHLSFDEIDAHCQASSGTPRETLEADSRAVAARYASGELDFNTADAIMNDLFAYAAARFADGVPPGT